MTQENKMPEILGINGTPYRINSSYMDLLDKHEELKAIAEKMAKVLSDFQFNIDNFDRYGNLKNLDDALTEYNKYKGMIKCQ